MAAEEEKGPFFNPEREGRLTVEGIIGALEGIYTRQQAFSQVNVMALNSRKLATFRGLLTEKTGEIDDLVGGTRGEIGLFVIALFGVALEEVEEMEGAEIYGVTLLTRYEGVSGRIHIYSDIDQLFQVSVMPTVPDLYRY